MSVIPTKSPDLIRGECLDILHDYWGYDAFRPLQLDIITSVLQGHDTLGLLPTGGGKSLTFQIPALALDGLTIVVTPLISLMKDQVDNLRERGVKATYLHSGLTARENRLALDRCRLGKVKLLYLSPEKLQSPSFVNQLHLLDVSLIVVDEAHCISQWGYDFRPSYLKIRLLRERFPVAPVLALTASATPEVVDDIQRELCFKENRVFARSFARDNISYIVRRCDLKDEMLLKVLKGVNGSGIVYVRSRKRSKELATFLKEASISADFYHAGLSVEEKEMKQNQWKSGQTRIIVATNAFGMGIDKPDVRVVVHYDLPSSLEEYYQEAGRAGRDGLHSFAVLLVGRGDKALLKRRVTEAFPSKDYIKKVYDLAGGFLDVAVEGGYNQLFEFNFGKFCATYNLQPVPARSALVLLSQAGYIDFVEEIATRSRVMVVVQKHELYDLPVDQTTQLVLQSILRMYTGLFADYVHIDEPQIAHRLNITEQAVYEALLTLSRMHIISYVPHKSTPYIFYTTSRELSRHLIIPRAVYEERRKRLEKRVDAMREFAFSTDSCRENIILSYFGEKPDHTCGTCDVCRGQRKHSSSTAPQDPYTPTPEQSLIYLASQPGGHPLQYMLDQISHPREEVIQALRNLMDRGVISMSPDGVFTAKC